MRRWLLLLAAMSCGSSHPESITWSPPVEIATGGGERGPWQQNNSRYDFVDDPSVALERNGDTAVVWVDQARKDVFWQVYSPDGKKRLDAPLNISRSPDEFSWLPRIALSPLDPSHIYILWQEIVFSGGPHGGEIFFARSLDGGRTFERPKNLSTSIEGDGKGRFDSERWHNGSLDIIVGEDGVIYAAWTDYEGNLRFRRSRDAGKTFDPELIVAKGGPVPARAPALACGKGMIYVVWTVGEDTNADIRIASSRDGKTFSAPTLVEHTQGYSDAPKVAVDTHGIVHVAFAQTKGGPFDAAEVRYTRSRDGRTFEKSRVISQPHAADVGGAFPQLALEGDRIFVTWEYYPHSKAMPHGIGIAYSYDGGKRFTQPRLIEGTSDVGPNGGFEGRLMRKLDVRGDSIVVVNSAKRDSESSRVWLVRGALPSHL